MRRYMVNDSGLVEVPGYSEECWIDVEAPDDDDCRFLREDLGIPASFLDSVADEDENPRVDSEGGWVLTILRIPIEDVRTSLPYTTVPIGIMTRGRTIVTISHFANEVIPAFVAGTRQKKINISGPSNFILHIIYSTAFFYLRYLKILYHGVIEAQKDMERSVRNEDLIRMMHIQKTLVYFNTSLRGNEVLMERLKKTYPEDLDLYLLDDVEIELKQADNTVNIYSNILSGTMDTFESIISNNVNVIMKRLTSMSIILMVPTIVASFYGMNVDVGVAQYRLAFLWIIIGAVLLTVCTYWVMRRLRWF